MIIRRDTESAGLCPDWLVDMIFWAAVVAMVVAGALLLRHDFSNCAPIYEPCYSD